jgi:hypothetical protein
MMLYSLTLFIMIAFFYTLFTRLTFDNPRFRDGFWYGCATAFMSTSIMQDVVGQMAYINMISANWSPASVTVPLALLVMTILTFTLYVSYKIMAKKENTQKKEGE